MTTRVVVAYRDDGHDRLGMTYCESLFQELDWNESPVVSEWKFEMLACGALREVAAAEACQARLVVLATDSADGLPDCVKEWVQCWSLVKSPGRNVLVVVLSESAGCPGTRWPDFSHLEEKMKMCGRDYFVYAAGRSLEDGGGFCLAEAKQVVRIGQLASGDLSQVASALSMADGKASGSSGDDSYPEPET